MQAGIIGLPNVGKSTLFNALTKVGVSAENYPFCTIEPNVGVVDVPDHRLQILEDMEHPQKVIPATVEFVDIAGLVRGASKGEGLGNKFLSHIRNVDAIIHVVRCFEDENIIHVDITIDPVRDVETINLELIFADLETIEKRLERTKKMTKSGDKMYLRQVEVLENMKYELEKGKPVRKIDFDDQDKEFVRSIDLLTDKPILYVANINEDEILDTDDNKYVKTLKEYAKKEGSDVITICAKIEAEIADMDDSEKLSFLNDIGIEEPGLNKLIRKAYEMLGYITFFTAGPKEVRAWTILKNTKAPQAAGKIHSDFERGFIRAEVISFEDLVRAGSQTRARELGLMRSEGKDYIMHDGDVVVFRFNV
ncbi:MAG: redox-regulated ATPase YchF [Thermoanaerobacteraceae bacterium]|nr:redox-regulated ATPase YchF [Thermoanaerobacteraceae bacterium]